LRSVLGIANVVRAQSADSWVKTCDPPGNHPTRNGVHVESGIVRLASFSRVDLHIQPGMGRRLSIQQMRLPEIDAFSRTSIATTNHLTKFPVATVAGEEESIPVARQHAERRVCEIVIAVNALEIEHAGVERQ